MRENQIPQSKAKLRLLEAAEKLLAEKGFDAVSVRDVTQAAKANVAAVNYHFGSREGMLGWVITRYLVPIHQERMLRLDVVEKKWGSKAVPVEEIIEAFVRPVVSAVQKSELSEPLFCQLVGRIFGLQEDAFPESVEMQFKECLQRFIKAMGKALPKVEREELVWRMHFMMGALNHMLTHQESLQRISLGAAGAPSLEVTLSRFIRFACASLRDGVEAPEPTVKKGPQATFDF